MSKITFQHSGNFGDIVYSLPFCLSYMKHHGYANADYVLLTNVRAEYSSPHPFGNVRMTNAAAEMIKPLLSSQSWISDIIITDRPQTGVFNLDNFRNLGLNLGSGSISQWYNYLAPEISSFKSLEVPWLGPILDEKLPIDCRDRIVVFRSNRYRNRNVSLKPLAKYQEKLLFIGLPSEHTDFQSKVCLCKYKPVSNFLEAAQIIQSARLVVGNQTGFFSIAEASKTPRLLEQAFECPNVIMSGGYYHYIINDIQLDAVLEQMPGLIDK